MIEMLDYNPWLESITLSSSAFNIYRKLFMPKDSLGIIRRRNVNQSLNAKLWLVYESDKLGPQREIKHEYRLGIGRYIADGFLEPENDGDRGIVYEYYGCIYHACPRCFSGNDLIPVADDYEKSEKFTISMQARREQHLYRRARILAAGYGLREKWDCEFSLFLKSNPDIKTKLLDNPELLYNGLSVRESIFGGKVEGITLFKSCGSDERIRCLDVVSMYPAIQMRYPYPYGHPRLRIKGIEKCAEYLPDLHKYDGLIACLVLADPSIFLPILPYRSNGRLIFGLCRRCIELMQVIPCQHGERERALFGCWPICEINFAVQRGYRVIEAHEIWIYDTVQYNPADPNSPGLFSKYMLYFLKKKIESSGWPSHCVTEQAKAAFIRVCKERDGVDLEASEMRYSSGGRYASKSFLNCLWGRLCMRPPKVGTLIFDDWASLDQFVSNEGVIVKNIIAGENNCLVNWSYRDDGDEEFRGKDTQVCEVIGAYTCSYGRQLLHTELERMPEPIYGDTDSAFFVEKIGEQGPNKYCPVIGDSLGMWSDEIHSKFGPTAYIQAFVCSGPKAYAYIVKYTDDPDKQDEVIKYKGYRSTSSNPLTFDKLKCMVLGSTDACESNQYRIISPLDISRDKQFHVLSGPSTKTFQFTFNKRVCIAEHRFTRANTNNNNNNLSIKTMPFGYRI